MLFHAALVENNTGMYLTQIQSEIDSLKALFGFIWAVAKLGSFQSYKSHSHPLPLLKEWGRTWRIPEYRNGGILKCP